MGFGELNKYVLRDETSDDPIQKIINKHTYEDDHHWLWYLEDLQNLGMNHSVSFTQSLRFLWSEETRAARQVIYELYRLTAKATPIQRLIVVEAVEATGNEFFEVMAPISYQHRSEIGSNMLFFGHVHLSVETGHATGTQDLENIIQNIHLSEEECQEAFELVETVFKVFSDFLDSMLSYAQKSKNVRVLQAV
ncbi:MAG: hypothetical protein D6728_14950 [Cyanobacteria bacterium J055]|nr:MAG: hypothetical protein D6728_14950 [Cyanobacteria bacterium J055]